MSQAGCLALPSALILRQSHSRILRPKATTHIHPALIRPHLLVVCGKLGNGARARSYVRVEPTAPVAPNPIAAAPWYVKGAAVLLGCVAVFKLISRLRGKGYVYRVGCYFKGQLQTGGASLLCAFVSNVLSFEQVSWATGREGFDRRGQACKTAGG